MTIAIGLYIILKDLEYCDKYMANTKEMGRNIALRTSLAASVVIGSAAGLFNDSHNADAENVSAGISSRPYLQNKYVIPGIALDSNPFERNDPKPLKTTLESPINNSTFQGKDIVNIKASAVDENDESKLKILIDDHPIPVGFIIEKECVSGVIKEEKTEEKIYAGVVCDIKVDASKLSLGNHVIEAKGSTATTLGGTRRETIVESDFATISRK